MAHILIVDDDHGVRAMLEDYFTARGDRVSGIDSGAEIERLLSAGVDIVLLDINLPKEDGFSVLQRVRMRGHATPVILLTSRSDQVDKVLGLEVGADDYVTKPFDLREVEARIKTVLRRGARGPAAATTPAAGPPRHAPPLEERRRGRPAHQRGVLHPPRLPAAAAPGAEPRRSHRRLQAAS